MRRAEQISEEDRVLFESVARAVISDKRGTLAEQISPAKRCGAPLRGAWRALERTAPARRAPAAPPPEPRRRDLDLLQRHRRVQRRRPRVRDHHGPRPTDARAVGERAGEPALRHRGLESGLGYTWSENAHEFRLTPWHNDPVTDASGEAFYLRDEETGQFWSPTPLPCGGAAAPTSRGTASATACSSTPRTASSSELRSTWTSRRRSSSRC